jgi:hypothetical protein
MEQTFLNFHTKHKAISDMQTIISNSAHIAEENKVKFKKILEEAQFLLHQNDEFYSKFAEVFEAMATFEFNKHISVLKDETEFVRFMSLGINTIVDELKENALHKNLIHSFFESLDIPNTMAILTNCEGKITFVNSGTDGLPNFNEKALLGQNIFSILKDFDYLDKMIKEKGSIRKLPATISWKGQEISCDLSVSISTECGKIYGLIYVIKLPSISFTRPQNF